MNTVIKINENHDYTINSEPITTDIMEEVGYTIVDREEFIDDLISWIAESDHNSKDRVLMKSDLEYLMSLDDRYIFSSLSTNEYISFSDEENRFHQIGKEMLSHLSK